MAESGCRWCGIPLPLRRGSGRRREFCSSGCRSALHGRVRQLGVDRTRVVWDLQCLRQMASASRGERKQIRLEVVWLVKRLAEIDAELERLRGEPARRTPAAASVGGASGQGESPGVAAGVGSSGAPRGSIPTEQKEPG